MGVRWRSDGCQVALRACRMADAWLRVHTYDSMDISSPTVTLTSHDVIHTIVPHTQFLFTSTYPKPPIDNPITPCDAEVVDIWDQRFYMVLDPNEALTESLPSLGIVSENPLAILEPCGVVAKSLEPIIGKFAHMRRIWIAFHLQSCTSFRSSLPT